jgi:LacI family transcriptional regulator
MENDDSLLSSRTGDAPRRVTLRDVARAVGVDPSTVSRALQNPERINSSTVARIEAAVEELGYQVKVRKEVPVQRMPAEPARQAYRFATTIYDVARVAGVNPSTVSRALSMPGRLHPETEKRVHAAAKELNYRLNPMARALPTGRTFTLGLLLADITNPMFFEVVRGAEREAAAHGFTLIIAESQESSQREVETAFRLLPSIDGLILVSTRLNDEQILDLSERKPLVVINRRVTGVPSVVPDLTGGIDEAVAHLASLGHASIAFLSGPKGSWMSFARWTILKDRAAMRGLRLCSIGPGAPTLLGGSSALAKVVAADVTAVVAYNDLMAIGLLRAAQAGGLDVPSRLSIIGFDDIFGSDFTSPPLTTVRTPLGLLGANAVRRVLGDMAHVTLPRPAGEGEPLVTELLIRGSTSAPETGPS